MKKSLILGALAIAGMALAGCDDDVTTLVRTAAPTSTATPDDTESPAPLPSETEARATATPTPTHTVEPQATASPAPSSTPAGPAQGPMITYFGITTADNRPIESSGTDSLGRPIFERELGTGLSVIVEAESGLDGRPVGTQAFESVGLPDLQMLLSRPLGDGNPAVCDIEDGSVGGVPAIEPPVFSNDPTTVDAINDLGCRVNDGTGQTVARTSSDQACTYSDSGQFSFVDVRSSAQFCLPIARAWDFPQGDTVVTARVRSVFGSFGDQQQIVVRIARSLTPLPTSPPQTPTPVGTQVPPEITYFGLAAADDAFVEPIGVDDEGRDIYTRLIGHAFSLVIEAAPMAGGRPVGPNGFSPDGLPPDLQVLVSRDLGDGAPEVCDVDVDNQIFGGVPGFDPPSFTSEQDVVDALNDLGCRVNDGTGAPLGRPAAFPCTRDPFGNFTFVDPRSAIQFCLPIARAWSFQDGDTVVAVRVRSTNGVLSPVSEILISVEGDELEGF